MSNSLGLLHYQKKELNDKKRLNGKLSGEDIDDIPCTTDDFCNEAVTDLINRTFKREHRPVITSNITCMDLKTGKKTRPEQHGVCGVPSE